MKCKRGLMNGDRRWAGRGEGERVGKKVGSGWRRGGGGVLDV